MSLKNLQEVVLENIADGHGYDKMTASPPSYTQQRNMAEDELDHMSHSEFLERLSRALDEMFPIEEK